MLSSFESPAGEYTELRLSLDEHFLKPSTFIGRASGNALIGIGIFNDDYLLIDRAEEPRHMDLVITNFNGQFLCRLFDMHNKRLISACDNHPPIDINPDDSFIIEGVVKTSLRCHRARSL